MKIAVCCETEDAGGLVAAEFRTSPFLLMIDVEENVIYHVFGKQDPENMVFAEKITGEGCEAVICGPMEKEPFEYLARAGVSRFDGSGHKAQRAFIRFLRNQLPLIRDYIGGPGAAGHSHDFACDCGENEFPSARTLSAELQEGISPEREDSLFLLSAEEAEKLPDEIEIPDGMDKKSIEEYLRFLAGSAGEKAQQQGETQ